MSVCFASDVWGLVALGENPASQRFVYLLFILACQRIIRVRSVLVKSACEHTSD
ncbi:hypothetical protein [Teredinibacter waterburyi]|uniref:hypothetical protein n=1 Tax=Teredinibacter waterburyi TaxID=1500538 RepID=UPI00165FCDA7|nr:hypothetical protein [Teredinibacter waterburyi]